MRVPKATEAGFTRAVLAFAELNGWRCYHARPARTAGGWRTPVQGRGAAGWPDLVAVRVPRIVAAELKVNGGRLTAEQTAWLSLLGCSGAEAYCWTPDSWPTIERVLGAPAGGGGPAG